MSDSSPGQPAPEGKPAMALPGTSPVPQTETSTSDGTVVARDPLSSGQPTPGSLPETDLVHDGRDPLDTSPLPEQGPSFLKRLLLILLAVVLIGGIGYGLYAYLSGSGGADSPVELTYWGLWEPTEVMDQVITTFEAEHPGVTVTYAQQSKQDYRERLQNALQQGQGPDLFRFHNTWTPMLASQLATLPSDVMTSATFNETFYPVAAEWMTTSRGIVGIPLMFDGLGLYYNTEVMQAAGIEPPTTWEELRRVARQLTISQDDQILRAGVALGTANNVEHWSDILAAMMLQNAADPVKPNNQLGQDALTFYTLFSTRDKVWDSSLPMATQAFATGKVVMMIAPSWRAHEIAVINPELSFAIAPLPQLPDTAVSWASYWAEGVAAQSSKREQQAAWEFLEYLSRKEVMRDFYAAASTHPGRLFGEPFSRVDMADQLARDPFVGAYISQAPQATSWYMASETYDNGLNDQIIKYYEDAVNSMNSGGQAAKVLATVEQGVAQVLSQYGLR